MSFGGPIDGMFDSQKSNKKLLRKRKSLKEINQSYQHPRLSETKANPQNIQDKYAKRTGRKIVKKRKYTFIMRWVVTLLISALILWLMLSIDFGQIIEAIQ